MNFMLAVLLLCSLCATAFIPYQNGKIRRRFTERNVATTPEKDERAADGQWWHDGVDFGCTACGKCCVNDGEVWFDMDEFYELSEYLNMSYTDVLDDYAEEVKSGWVKLKDKKETSTGHGCVFLGDDDKTCGVYSARPIQCRTYPYWPRLLTSEDAWKKEAVVTDDKAGKHWSAANGGCEGINHPDAQKVPVTTVHRNSELDKMYNGMFPFMQSGEDRERLVSKLDIIKGVTRSTREWVKQFVVGFNLCPFADKVFTDNSIRYRVYFGGNDVDKIKEKLRYESLALLTAPEEEVSTTLLLMPFVTMPFEDWYELSLEIEDEYMPTMEKYFQGPKKRERRPSLKDKLLKRKAAASTQQTDARQSGSDNGGLADSGDSKSEKDTELQLAFFHPAFQWASDGTGEDDFNQAINYEKRAPFPTINLLRAPRVREYANEMKTAKIAHSNVESLESVGSETLTNEFARIVRLALE